MGLHVVQLGPYPPPEGGISRNMLAIRDRLAVAGHRCSIVATSRSSRIEKEQDVYHPATAWELIQVIRGLRANIIHLHIGGDVTPRVLSLMAAVGAVGIGKSVLTLHSGGYPETSHGRAANRYTVRGAIFRAFKRLIAVNEMIAEVFKRYGVKESKVRLISPFSCTRPDNSLQLPDHISAFCAEHAPLLAAVGGLEKDYDPLFLINSIAAIKKRYPSAGLVIVGGGSMHDEVQRTVDQNGSAENVLIASDVPHAITLKLMERVDMMLRTTLFDGDAISVREALFLGTPVIASDNGMRPSGVRLLSERTAEELINAIDDCLLQGRSSGSGDADFRNIDEVVRLYEGIAVR